MNNVIQFKKPTRKVKPEFHRGMEEVLKYFEDAMSNKDTEITVDVPEDIKKRIESLKWFTLKRRGCL